jgi:eukaryotic-like serine/threonine-protein kinase
MGADPSPPLNRKHDAAWAERLVDEVVRGWRDGPGPCAEEVLARHPALADHPEAAVRLIYEEICARREAGQDLATEEVLSRFPGWRAQLQVLLKLHSLLDLGPAPPIWPEVGEELGEFRLVAELGRGAQGRVFLATQAGLGGRPVVLKVTPCTGQEHVALARLQHTHVVPLYAAHEDPDRNLRALCMPYFGGATLHELLRDLRDPCSARTGRHLLDALDRLQGRRQPGLPPRGSARLLLARLSYVQAVCWVGACLAEALGYAHERGLVHLDVKPSNVLLGADGQPMLLDFHIAQGPIRPGGEPPERLGGTPVYASPEQRAAMDAVRSGAPIPAAVDGRSDVYSLGLLLYEALGGEVPHEPAGPPPRLRLPHVSRGLADILARCLAPRPEARYQSATELAEDLRRHLNDLPLRGVPNRSLLERWRKWRRRRPFRFSLLVMGAAVLAAAVALGASLLSNFGRQRHEAEADLAEGRRHLEARAYPEAAARLSRGQAVARGLPGGGELARDLGAELRRARRGQAVRQLHALADRLRFLCGAASPQGSLASLRPLWGAVWGTRKALLNREGAELPAEVEGGLRTDLLDLAIIWADLSVRLAGPGERSASARAALKVLDETEAQFGPSAALARQRRACASACGEAGPESPTPPRADESPRTPWEHYALGRALLQAGDLEGACAALDRALELRPGAFWPRFHRGVCAYRLKLHEEAATAFEVCVALAPDKAECYFNRGLARAALGRTAEALRDHDEALRRNPGLGAAALSRGLLHYEQRRYAEAAADLHRALAGGADPAAAHYNLALVHLARQDPAAARASVARALQADPRHAEALKLRAQLDRARGG